jgi:hypothetical protein
VRGIEQDVTACGQALEQVDLLQQRRILDDQSVGLQHRLADADLLIVDAAERHDRRAHPFRSEAGKRLGVFPFEKRGNRQHFGAGNHTLAAAPVNAALENQASTAALASPLSGDARGFIGEGSRSPSSAFSPHCRRRL